MRYLVISDTHRKIRPAIDLIHELHSLIDGVIHLGDLTADFEELQALFQDVYGLAFLGVSGNCDFYPKKATPLRRSFTAEGVTVFLCHGHMYHVKGSGGDLTLLESAARSQGASVALFGHTHIPFLREERGMLMLNPGSLSEPRGGSSPSYALLELEKGRFAGQIYTLFDPLHRLS